MLICWRKHAGSLIGALVLLVCASAAYGMDSYSPSNKQLTISSVAIGNAIYSNVVVTVGDIIRYPMGTAANGSEDSYDPGTGELTVQSVTVGSTTYYNVIVTVAALVSIGDVTGADIYDGTNLTISYVQRDGNIYDNVVVAEALGNVVRVAGGMPTLAQDEYYSSTNQLNIPAVQFGGKVYTNVIVTVGKIVSVCGTGEGALLLGTNDAHILQLGQFGTEFTPDEHMTYNRQPNGSVNVWIAGGLVSGTAGDTFGFATNDLINLSPLLSSGGIAANLLGPSGIGTENFDADYAGPGAVITALNGADLLMIYHAENHEFAGVNYPFIPFYASIGIARSTDSGTTWLREGQILTGMIPKPAAAPSPAQGLGAANPSAIVVGGYIYVYYVDIGVNGGPSPDVIHVARAPVSSDGSPGSWQKFYNGSFSQPGLGGLSTPVQGQVPPGPATISAGNPDISYNTYLHQYVLVFDSNVGWHYSTSPDLVTWTLRGQIFTFPSPHDNLQTGDLWYTSPTLVSPEQSNEQTSSCAGFLYYAKGVWNVTPHTMYRVPFTFQ